jgi:predicted AlkP superfamily pyrophosphatase or phosphodiesterase
MLDRMGQRYGMLPSEIAERATTFDMVIMDISLSVERHNQDKQDPNYVPPVSTEDLIKIKERASV